MRKLYEIKEDIANLIEINADRFVNGETGEIINKADFDALQMEYSEKMEGVALGYKREVAMAEAIDAEIKALKARKDYHDKKAEGYKGFMAAELAGNKFETPKVRISWRKSEAVEVTNIDRLPEKYLRIVTNIDPDKKQLKADLKAGAVVDGCQLVTKNNIQIK